MSLFKNYRPYLAMWCMVFFLLASQICIAGQISGKKDSISICSGSICDKVPQLDSIIKFHFENYHFNGCILLAENGRIVYENALGYSDYDNKTPLKENDLFQLASVSKQFTAMAIMILRDRGLINLNDSVSKYIPGFPYRGIRVSDLLHHTSALPEYVNTSAFNRYLPDKDTLRNRDLLNIMIQHKLPLTGTPGARYKYCNTGYAMLSIIIENVSGMTYPQFMRKNIFEPLGMTNTYCFEEIADCPGNVCKVLPYNLNDSKTEQFNFITGDKGIFSCVHDMYLWDQSLYADKLVSKKTMDEAFTPAIAADGDTIKYGYGWRIYQYDEGKRLIWHRGLWQTFNPAIMRYVDDNKTIIILATIIPPYSGTRLINDIDSIWLKPDQGEQTAQSDKKDD